MPNDAKLGLVVGVGLVITVAVIFFRTDLITRKPAGQSPAATVSPMKSPLSEGPRDSHRPTPAQTTSQAEETP
jgi:hypothetical protein